MERNKKIIISVVGIILVLLGLIGFTYGYYLTNIRGNTNDKSITVSLETLELTYDDGNGFIEAKDVLPGEEITTKKFTITNTGTKKVVNYTVYLEDVVNTFADKSDLDLTLKCSSTNGTCNGNEMIFPSSNSLLVLNDIEVGEVQSYELKVVFKETNDDQTDNMQKNISGNIIIKDFRSTKQEIVKNEGTKNITLDNSILTNSLLLYGNSTQETRSGKNLIPYPYASTTLTSNGVVWTDNKDGSITTSGTATDYSAFILFNKMDISAYQGKNLTVSLNSTDNVNIVCQIALYSSDGTTSLYSNSSSNDVTLSVPTEGKYLSLYLKRNNNVATSGTIRPQLELASTATSYEKYGSSPSPNYPSEIKSVGDLVSDASDANNGKYKIPVKITGKNLFDSKELMNFGATLQSDGSYYWEKATSSSNIIWENSEGYTGRYTITSKIKYNSSTARGEFFIFNYTDGTKYEYWGRGFPTEYTEFTFTTPADKVLKNITISYGTINVSTNMLDIQLEKSSTLTEYELYKETVSNIYLDEPLRKIGNYSDYIDLKNKKVVRNIVEYTFTGNESWTLGQYPPTGAYQFYKNKFTDMTSDVSETLNTHFSNARKINGSGLGGSYNIFPSTELNLTTVDEFKTWLKNNNVKVNYVITTPTESNIDLSNIKLYDGINNITIDTSISPSKISTEYIN